MVAQILSVRISGAGKAANSLARHRAQSVPTLQAAARDRATQTEQKFKQQMAAEYTSAWATGRVAAGVSSKVETDQNGVAVSFFIPEFRELRFITAALGGHFRNFPVGPFPIVPRSRKALFIRFPNSMARNFIRGAGERFEGSRAGNEDFGPGILTKRVIWGRRSGGFPRDVISEVAQSEGEAFVADVEAAMAGSLSRISS